MLEFNAFRRLSLQLLWEAEVLWIEDVVADMPGLAIFAFVHLCRFFLAERCRAEPSEDGDLIAAFIDRVEDWPWANNLGAFAAAFIELEGVAGVDLLARGMLSDPTQPLDKVEQIIMALSVHHALAEPALRDAIGETIHGLVALRPETGVAVARQFSLRADWSQTAVLEPLVRARNFSTMGDLLTVSVYLATARQETMRTGGTE